MRVSLECENTNTVQHIGHNNVYKKWNPKIKLKLNLARYEIITIIMICLIISRVSFGEEWDWRRELRERWRIKWRSKKKGKNLFVLMESDPDMDFVHGLPEHESTQRHREVRCHSHHLSSFSSLFRFSFKSLLCYFSLLSFFFCV